MSVKNYTPPRHQVRHEYARRYAEKVEYHENGFTEFDRWLAQEFRIAAERFISEGDSKDALLAYADRVERGQDK